MVTQFKFLNSNPVAGAFQGLEDQEEHAEVRLQSCSNNPNIYPIIPIYITLYNPNIMVVSIFFSIIPIYHWHRYAVRQSGKSENAFHNHVKPSAFPDFV